MRIVKLVVDNFKRLVAVEITPDGDLVVLSGKNNSGKSSALDAIWAAVGGAAACPDKPIREGAEKGEVRLELDNGLIVERTFTKKGTYLKVTAEDGAQYPKPQDMLDALIGRVGFDPLAFARKKPKAQVEELLHVVDIGIDLDEHETKRQALYDKRADANREKKRFEGALAEQTRYDDAPGAVVSAGDLAGKITEAERTNEERMKAGNRIRQIGMSIRELQQEEKKLKTWLETGERIDVDALKTRLATVEADNEKVRTNERYDELKAESETAKTAAAKLDKKLKLHDEKKDTALAAAKFPVPGLSFNDEGVLYNGIPFAIALRPSNSR